MIESKRLSIRPVHKKDVSVFHQWWTDGEVMSHVGFPNGLNISLDHVKKTLNHSITSTCPTQTKIFVIELLEHREPIGECSYHNLKVEDKTIEIGIKIADKSAQGKGYGKEALGVFIDYLFQTFDLKQVLIDTLATNHRAQSLYEKIGSKVKEHKHNFWTNPEGTTFDAVFYTLDYHDFYAYYKH